MASDPKQLTPASSAQDLATLTPAQLAQIVAQAKPIEGPVGYSNNVVVVGGLNDPMLIFMRPRPMFAPTGEFANVALGEASALVHLSWITLKDLHWAVGLQIAQYKETHGEIVTDAMKARAATTKK